MTPIYDLEFFPGSGQKYSPADFIEGLTNKTEVAIIERRLGLLMNHPQMEWGHYVEITKIDENLLQITAGSHRFYCCVDDNTIIVFYICRKVSQKALRQDLKRAGINRDLYLKENRNG